MARTERLWVCNSIFNNIGVKILVGETAEVHGPSVSYGHIVSQHVCRVHLITHCSRSDSLTFGRDRYTDYKGRYNSTYYTIAATKYVKGIDNDTKQQAILLQEMFGFICPI